jgi:tetratricopeptide (TPR) repeat protein
MSHAPIRPISPALPSAPTPFPLVPRIIKQEFNSAQEYYDKERYDFAKSSFKRVIKMTDKIQSGTWTLSAELWTIKGTSHHYLNQYYDAIRCFDEALLKNPNYLESLKPKSLTLRKIGRYYESLQVLNRYLSDHPKANDVKNVRGMVYDDLGRYEEAIDAF